MAAQSTAGEARKKVIRLWDLPLRLFHWLLLVALCAAVITAQIGGNLMHIHARLGLFILGLLSFRLVWGFIGSTYARFAEFLPSIGKIKQYLHGEWRRPGHNPLGALAVFALLAILLAQCLTGLFSNDDIAFTAPLYALVAKDISDQMTGFHHLLANFIYLLVGIHVAAILYYVLVKKEKLLGPMLNGKKELDEDAAAAPSATGGGWLALLAALLIAAGVVYVASGALLPVEVPVPQSSTPAW